MKRILFIMVLAPVVGCGGTVLEDGSEESVVEASAGATMPCAGGSANIELRAFIPSSLCGQNDNPENTSCPGNRGNPPGYPEPGSAADRFHGDFRNFSASWIANHRLAEYVFVPDLSHGCAVPGTAFNADDMASNKCSFNPHANNYSAQSARATVNVDANNAICLSNTQYHVDYQVDAGYPFGPQIFDNHIFDELLVDSSWSQGAQNYAVAFRHTPFPFHEMIISCNGPKNMVVHQHTAKDCGPSLNNLGSGHKRDITGLVRFQVKNGTLTVF